MRVLDFILPFYGQSECDFLLPKGKVAQDPPLVKKAKEYRQKLKEKRAQCQKLFDVANDAQSGAEVAIGRAESTNFEIIKAAAVKKAALRGCTDMDLRKRSDLAIYGKDDFLKPPSTSEPSNALPAPAASSSAQATVEKEIEAAVSNNGGSAMSASIGSEAGSQVTATMNSGSSGTANTMSATIGSGSGGIQASMGPNGPVASINGMNIPSMPAMIERKAILAGKVGQTKADNLRKSSPSALDKMMNPSGITIAHKKELEQELDRDVERALVHNLGSSFLQESQQRHEKHEHVSHSRARHHAKAKASSRKRIGRTNMKLVASAARKAKYAQKLGNTRSKKKTLAPDSQPWDKWMSGVRDQGLLTADDARKVIASSCISSYMV